MELDMANPSQSLPFPTSQSTAEKTPEPGSLPARDAAGGPRSSDPAIDRVVQGAHQAVDRVAEKAVPAVERLRAGVGGMAEAAQAHADELAALGDEWMESCRTSVRQHPLAAVALALVAGVAISRLMK
jgi:hypothetical protein